MNLHSSFVLVAALAAALPVLRAQNPPSAAVNLVSNGGFEQFSAQDNVWDGVDSEGYLAGRRFGLSALAENGNFRTIAMPMSVTAGDLNGDGLIDILVADPTGYLQVYFNSGSKTEPKFTQSEYFPLFLSGTPSARQKGPRINLYDWSRRGLLDLAVGNYSGEVYFIPNTGSAGVPDFRQPADLEKATVPTTKKNELWANLVAPAAFDFNKDGRTDLVLGEGSYSANSVHLLINQGSNNQPKFDETNRFYLAYGDGREHLTPAIIDYNGDGEMDLIASTREGQVGVYLNPGPLWKPGTEFKYSTDIKFGTSDNLGGLVTVFATDLNGDGLPDILIGKSNGRIALSLNSGTKTAPNFSVPTDLKGTEIYGRNMRTPVDWSADVGLERGNFYGAATVFSAEDEPSLAPAEGSHCLKIGYFPSLNKTLKVPALIVPGNANQQNLWMNNIEFTAARLPGDVFLIQKAIPELKIGSSYVLSFKSKGNNASALRWTLSWRGSTKLAENKVESGERGSARVTRFEASETAKTDGAYNAGSTWSITNKTFTVEKFKDKNLANLVKVEAVIELRGTLTPNLGAVYLDDVQLVEKK